MLRVSSLGLIRYHDTLCFLSLRLNRLASTVARQTLETGASDQSASRAKGSSSRNEPSNSNVRPTSNEASRSPEVVGRRRRTIIPPLRISSVRGKRNLRKVFEGLRDRPETASDTTSIPPTSDMLDTLVNPPGDRSGRPEASVGMASNAELSALTQDREREYLQIALALAPSMTEAWDAYERLMTIPQRAGCPPVHYSSLHRLARLLASTRPHTRTVFMRLLSVLSTIHNTGGQVKLWEWNALIDAAGRGWRKTRMEDFQAALDIYHDMVSQKAPGATFSKHHDTAQEPSSHSTTVKPDIVTYTTLLNIAGRTLNPATVRHAMSVLEESGLPHSRLFHLALIRYFTRKNDLVGVRTTILRMKEQGFELGLDGINACIWAYARNGHVDVASTMYRILKYRIAPDEDDGEDDITLAADKLAATEGLTIPTNLKPDATTYHVLVQCYAYHGDLARCLQVFMDMMVYSRYAHRKDAAVSADPSWTLPAFRSIFLGFVRHGKHTQNLQEVESLTRRHASSAWTMENLDFLFNNFMKLPHDIKPSDRTIYWILSAFDATSESADSDTKLREVWRKLEEKFGGRWGGRLERFRQRIFKDP